MPCPRLGLYKGPVTTAVVTEINTFQSWLDKAQVDVTEYLDPAWTSWNPTAIDNLKNWRAAQPGRKVVIGLHLVPSSGGTIAQGNAGAYDAQFTTLGNLLKNNNLGDVVIRLGYEPNNPGIGPWAGTTDPTGYKNLFIRIRNLLKAISSNFQFDLNFAIGSNGLVTSFNTLYPGSAYVDIVGLNVYDVWWQHPGQTASARWNNTLTTAMGINAFRSFSTSVGKPISFPEWGLYAPGDNYAGGGDSTYFIDRMSEQVADARYHSYFNYNWTTFGSAIDAFPNAKARYKTVFGG